MPSQLSPITAGQREQLEARLVQRRSELDTQLAGLLAGESRPDHAREVLQQDSDDLRHRSEDREVDMARSDQDLRELGAVSEALRRIQTDSYGLCTDCEAPIPFERLKVEPWALRCVACESAREAPHSRLSSIPKEPTK
jgi:DnaK suppressor protein